MKKINEMTKVYGEDAGTHLSVLFHTEKINEPIQIILASIYFIF